MALPVIAERMLISSGVDEQASFGISSADSAHIMRILRDQLYSDRILAVLREYASNAWDANRMSGKGDVPIEVNMPTSLQPYLSIRDSGPGLSQDEVFNVYTQYGASTKRDTNEAIGMLGIGSKSAFSYTTAFTVTSWHGGVKKVYNASLDEKDIGIIQLLHSEPCEPDRTGIEIKVPVRSADFAEFTVRAKRLFRFFVPVPKFNIDIGIKAENDVLFDMKHGFLVNGDRYGNSAKAIVGCIPYRIDASKLSKLKIVNWTDNVGLKFEIGEVDFSASREELKYTERTLAAIDKKILAFGDELVDTFTKTWDRKDITQWEKRILLDEFSRCGISTQELYNKLGINHTFCLYSKTPEAETFVENEYRKRGYYYGSTASALNASRKTYFLIRDERRALSGYDVKDFSNVIILSPIKGKTVNDVKAEINKLLKENDASGAPIKLTSELTWIKPKRDVTYADKTKYSRKAFVFRDVSSSIKRKSDRWTPENVDDGDKNVFVILSRFEPKNITNYMNVFNKDKQLAESFGIKFPKIVGYKTTDSKPVTISSVKGIHYLDWQKTLYKKLLKNKKFKDAAEYLAWQRQFSWSYSISSKLETLSKSLIDAGLEKEHEIVLFIANVRKAKLEKKFQNYNEQLLKDNIKSLAMDALELEADVMLASILNKYPLIGDSADDLFCLNDENKVHHWVDYIKFKDMPANSRSKEEKK